MTLFILKLRIDFLDFNLSLQGDLVILPAFSSLKRIKSLKDKKTEYW